MTTTYVAFDTRSGQIVSVHHGLADSDQALARARSRAKIGEEHIAVIASPAGAAARGKHYRVDPAAKVLVEATAGEGGVGFAMGRIL